MGRYLKFILIYYFYSVKYNIFGIAKLIEEDLLIDPVQLILDEHNKYRHIHGAPNLRLDNHLTRDAQEWSDHISRLGASVYRPYIELGQNLWRRSNVTVADLMTSDDVNPVKFWYDQRAHYPGYYDPDQAQYSGAFTQVIWFDTRKLGVGISHGRSKLYIVCFYEPAGNVVADNYEDTVYNYRKNVLNMEGYTWRSPPTIYYITVVILVSIVIVVFKLIQIYTRVNLF